MEQLHIGTREPLFFMHVPKTAGMSMRLFLRNQYHIRDVCPATRWQELLGCLDDIERYRLFQGHFRYNLRELLAPNTKVLVLLREPLRRTVSALQHLQRDPDFHPDHLLAKGLTISEMIRHPYLTRKQDNVQARFLCASRTAPEVSSYLRRELVRNPSADAGNLEEPPDLLLAQDRLAKIEFVGLTEAIGDVVSQMVREMQYHPPLHFPLLNQAPAGDDPLELLSDEDIAILRNYNELDLALYEFAAHLIERRRFEYRMCNLVRVGIYHVPEGSFEIPVAGVVPGSGWYGPEGEAGACWRWTGPGRFFTVEVALRPDVSYRLRLQFGALRPLSEGDLAVEINNTRADLKLEQAGRGYMCEITIPRTMLAQCAGICRIQFDTRQTSDLPPPERRSLGVAVRRIQFECLIGQPFQ